MFLWGKIIVLPFKISVDVNIISKRYFQFLVLTFFTYTKFLLWRPKNWNAFNFYICRILRHWFFRTKNCFWFISANFYNLANIFGLKKAKNMIFFMKNKIFIWFFILIVKGISRFRIHINYQAKELNYPI